ncbi:MAG: right-handed parallel beta-helix repeat-containing protein [Kiritimatiellales bacterium]|nr:right-handed parallel beta-helix repeat-containing protein [Kiritimatiellales bacterium]
MIKKHLAILILTTLTACLAAGAEVFFVDGDFQGENYNGKSWLSAFPTIDKAIEAASITGGEIWVKAGVYKPTENGKRTAAFRLHPGIKLYGGFRGNETVLEQRNRKANRTILSGDVGQPSDRSDNCYHVLLGAPNTVLDGFIISGGNADGKDAQGTGGGMLFQTQENLPHQAGKYNAVVSNCIFEKNHANQGGAIYCNKVAPEIRKCTFYSNSAGMGGAIAFHTVRHTRVAKCIFTSNFAEKHGGAVVASTESSVVHHKCTFMLNSAGGRGGAVYNVSTTIIKGIRPAYIDCTFSENSAKQRGGAMANGGNCAPAIIQCRFTANSAVQGGGAVANYDQVMANILDCSFRGNRGGAGLADIDQEDSARTTRKEVDIAALLNPSTESAGPDEKKPAFAQKLPPTGSLFKEEPKPDEKKTEKEPPLPPPLQTVDDVFVYNTAGTKVKLRTIIGGGDYTVLVNGCLTEPNFLKTYRGVEAASRDYAGKGVNFFYLYKALAHPENNGYLKPFTLKERAGHVMTAMSKLRTKVPWLYDMMDNQAFVALGKAPNGLFIFNKKSQILFFSESFDEFALRSELRELLGPVEKPTRATDLALPDITPISSPTSGLIERLRLRADDKTIPLEIIPQESKYPYFVKVRAEANRELLTTGNGRMYLGFNVDPIYRKVSWNNLGVTLKYAMKVPDGTAISPSVNEAPKVGAATDTDPREFMLEARNWKEAQPVQLTVTYSAHSETAKWTREITQFYLIYLKQDEFGGVVFGRNLKESNQPGEEEPADTAPAAPSTDMPFRRPFFRRL